MANDISQVHQIDWSRPWLQAWRAVGESLNQKAAQGRPLFQACNEALFALQDNLSSPVGPVHFVAQ